MATDWGDIASKVIGLGAPILGSALGGPLGAVAGNILADQFLQTGNYPFGSALAVSIMVVLMVLLFLLRRAQPAADPQ